MHQNMLKPKLACIKPKIQHLVIPVGSMALIPLLGLEVENKNNNSQRKQIETCQRSTTKEWIKRWWTCSKFTYQIVWNFE